MQQRQLLWLIGALGVLVLIAFLSGAFNNDFSQMDVPDFDIIADDIEKLVIGNETEGSTITLIKEAERWSLTTPIEATADSIALSRLTENLDLIELESVVSTNPDRYENYGVDGNAQHITVTTGGEEKKLYVGKSGPDYRAIYIRVEDDPRVFVTNGRLNIPSDLNAWRDKTLFNLRAFAVERVEVQQPTETYTVEMSSGSWQIRTGSETAQADSAGVERWLDRFTPLKGTGFNDALEATSIQEDATHILTFTLQGGQTKTIWLQEGESELFGVSSDLEQVATLSQNMLGDVRTREQFADPVTP